MGVSRDSYIFAGYVRGSPFLSTPEKAHLNRVNSYPIKRNFEAY